MKHTAFIRKAGIPNANGYVYTQEALDKALEQLQSKIENDRAFITHKNDVDFDLADIRGKITAAKVVDEEFSVEFELLDNFDPDDYDFGINGHGTVVDGKVLGISLSSIGMQLKPKPESIEDRNRRVLHAKGEHFLGDEELSSPTQGSGLRVRKCNYPGCNYEEEERKY